MSAARMVSRWECRPGAWPVMRCGIPLGWTRKTAEWRLETASGREGDDWRSKKSGSGEEGLRGMGSPARRKTTSVVPSSVLPALDLVGEVQFPRGRHVGADAAVLGD
ncbi:hypothetical protein GUJ93_ZPchr0013g37860 [Zizania palustris]|uniref:Uncharacterized protein n=1 Tax=Zizania palustris TaxID=103762 RepID=A0A8J6C449_ZIZPA|nr:hypothetical protein GUJ93_ZPchr0013g37860 [Zizania palustris]